MVVELGSTDTRREYPARSRDAGICGDQQIQTGEAPIAAKTIACRVA